jgi:hypothetical protein
MTSKVEIVSLLPENVCEGLWAGLWSFLVGYGHQGEGCVCLHSNNVFIHVNVLCDLLTQS